MAGITYVDGVTVATLFSIECPRCSQRVEVWGGDSPPGFHRITTYRDFCYYLRRIWWRKDGGTTGRWCCPACVTRKG